jgi:3'(2'), 5'-bisphosphate nucleotidase
MLAPLVCQIAKDAGKSIMQFYTKNHQNNLQLELKHDNSPVTKADLASHQIILRGLTTLTPDIKVVSEEDEGSIISHSPKGSFWLIDPLDGTKEFLLHNKEFTVNIALIVDSKSIWGVVYAPALDQIYWGGAEFGSYRQTRGLTTQISIAAQKKPKDVLKVVASKSHMDSKTSGFIKKLGPVELVQAGSSLKFCLIAEGSADIYPRLAPTYEWDTAAAQAVLEGAGGFVFDTSENILCYGKANILNEGFIASSTPLSKSTNLKND